MKSNRQLWRTDGTVAGTKPVNGTGRTIGPHGNGPMTITDVNGKIYFTGCAGIDRHSLWSFDFTATETAAINQAEDAVTVFPKCRVSNIWHYFFAC